MNTESRQHIAHPPCYIPDKEKCTNFFEKTLGLAGEMRTSLHQIQFGLQTWEWKPSEDKWKETQEDSILGFRELKSIIRNVYAMESTSKRWTWVAGMQDCLSDCYDRARGFGTLSLAGLESLD